MRIVQIVPELRPGRGVEAVAFHLDEEFRKRGIPTETFDVAAARAGALLSFRDGLTGRLALDLRVLWFSTVGTWLAGRRYGDRDAETIVICHNDVVAGDVYVNHGNLVGSMRARGHFWLRMIRNPLHLFTWARDSLRYGHGPHRVIVNLTAEEDRLLKQTYPALRARTVVIGNGVDVDRFRPDAAQRVATRRELDLADTDVAVVFVGHEFDRKGLPLLMQALAGLPEQFHLVVVGGTPEMIRSAASHSADLALGGRVHFVGRRNDPRPYLVAGDVFALPSAYEAYPLVVLEALACGLPVVATAVGSVPELISEHNGRVVARSAADIRAGLADLTESGLAACGRAARATAVNRAWPKVAEEYLALFDSILRERSQ